ncbi:MAG TPA: fatty acid desaturase CarF family protein [Myxococcaceae bacterium]|jgi:ubiquitin-conjugating enzyme E2 variant
MTPAPPGDYPRAEPYSRAEVAGHIAVTIPNAVVVLAAITWLIRHRDLGASAWPWLVPAAFLGTMAADFVSGILHWMFDTWFDEFRPQVRRMVVVVREHHIRPGAIHQTRWYHDAGPLSVIALGVSLPALLPMVLPGPAGPFGYAAVLAGVVTDLCIVFMLEFHKLGHRPPARGPLGWLQRAHLICSPQHHGRHHGGKHDYNYCIVHGLADVLLNRTRFWRTLESIISRLTGAQPRQNDRIWLDKYRQ